MLQFDELEGRWHEEDGPVGGTACIYQRRCIPRHADIAGQENEKVNND